MTDEIISGSVHRKTGDNSVIKYDFVYFIEDGGKHKMVSIEVTAAEMTDPEDISEAKTLANPKATTEKNNWVTENFDTPIITDDSSQNGPVTL